MVHFRLSLCALENKKQRHSHIAHKIKFMLCFSLLNSNLFTSTTSCIYEVSGVQIELSEGGIMNQVSSFFTSNYTSFVKQVCFQSGHSIECIESTLDIALTNYQLNSSKHELTFFQLSEIWERDCAPTLFDWDLAA